MDLGVRKGISEEVIFKPKQRVGDERNWEMPDERNGVCKSLEDGRNWPGGVGLRKPKGRMVQREAKEIGGAR